MTRPKKEVVFLDGRFVDGRAARVSALDRGFLYADGLFETIRIYRGHPYALAEHLARIEDAARKIRLPFPGSSSWWRETIARLLARNGLARSDAAVRITVSRGVGGDGLVFPRITRPTVLIVARPLAAGLDEMRRSGVAVALLGFHPGHDGLLQGLKTTDYLTAAIGKTIARERGAFEGLYQRKGEILEGTTSNLFVVRRGRVKTPALSRGILAGTTRDRVIALAREHRIPICEGRVTTRELLDADEAFLTASTIEVLPIARVDGRPIGTGSFAVSLGLHGIYVRDRDARIGQWSRK